MSSVRDCCLARIYYRKDFQPVYLSRSPTDTLNESDSFAPSSCFALLLRVSLSLASSTGCFRRDPRGDSQVSESNLCVPNTSISATRTSKLRRTSPPENLRAANSNPDPPEESSRARLKNRLEAATCSASSASFTKEARDSSECKCVGHNNDNNNGS